MEINFNKYANQLAPAIIQDASTGVVLMLGFMNAEAFEQTKNTGLVTFFSRSKNKLWVKGETSNNFLNVVDILIDCDGDTILVKAKPKGPVCHTGTDTCFNEINNSQDFFVELQKIIQQRQENPGSSSYVSSLFAKGINKIAQKVGEEAIELVIEAKDDDPDKFINEAADLFFHYLVLLQAKGFSLDNVRDVLKSRHKEEH